MRTLIYDIETMAERGWFFPPRYETNILHVDHHTHLLSFAWKWLGEPRTHVLGLDDFKSYRKAPHDDKALTQALHALLSEADLSIGHNSGSFDDKIALARVIYHRLPPVPPHKTMDTKRMAKAARFSSNKLDDLGEHLGLGRKVKHGDFEELWIGCDEGAPQAWKTMKKYNKQDVILDEKLYLRLRPYVTNNPSIALIDDMPEACPVCGKGPMRYVGKYYTKVNKVFNFQCLACLAYSKRRKAEGSAVHYVN